MTTLGIDPGINGGWAILDEIGHLVAAGDLPVIGLGTKKMVSAALFGGIVRQYAPQYAVIEQVGSRPGQGVSSMFRFGKACGILEGVIASCGIQVMFVSPLVWKKHFRLSGSGDEAKEASRIRAIETWPTRAEDFFTRKMDHGRAEAALLALWRLRAAHLSGETATGAAA